MKTGKDLEKDAIAEFDKHLEEELKLLIKKELSNVKACERNLKEAKERYEEILTKTTADVKYDIMRRQNTVELNSGLTWSAN